MQRRLSWSALSVAVLGLGAPMAASAQDAGDDIVVTGQRQAYRGDISLRETPQNIAVIDTEMLEDAGATRLSEALDLNASMARQNNFGGLWDNFAVRGFAGDENLPSGYLVNGFNAGRGFGGPRDMAGIERVEVLRGPNAALFGRGEPGGSVNLVTKIPAFDFAASAGISAGSFDTYRGDFDVTGGLSDSLALRAVGFYEDAGSFRDTLESTRYGFMPSALLRFGANTTLTYDLEITRQEIPFDRGVVAINNRLGVLPIERFLGEPGDGPLEAEVLGHQVQLQHDFSADWRILLGFGHRDTSLEGFSTEAELTAGRQRVFSDSQSLSRQRRFRDYDSTHVVWRGEVGGRFSTGGIEHRVLIGADHDAFENDQVFLRARPPLVASQTTNAAGNIINILNPVYGAFPPPIPGPQTNRVEDQESVGFYVQDQIRLSDRVQVRLGARHDDFNTDNLNRATGTRTSFSDSKLSPQAGIVFALNDALSLYGAYGEGFRPNSGADFAGRAFAPEESQSAEIGVKFSLLGGDIEATAAVYTMTKTNVLTADPVNAGFSIAIGEAESQGFEFDLNGELPGDVDLWVSYAYVDAQVARNALDPNFSSIIRAGDRLINVPEHTLSVMASKDFMFAERELELGAGVLYVGDRLGETATTFELPAYTTLRVFASYELSDALEIAGEINNVTDEEYYTNSFHRFWVAPGAPRNASVSLRFNF
jgi:iron complex outermembrane receptor protein